jgi:hypothetical protein
MKLMEMGDEIQNNTDDCSWITKCTRTDNDLHDLNELYDLHNLHEI